MPPSRRPPDDPHEWHSRARSNLVRAQTMLPGIAEPVTSEEYQRAVAIANAVVQWAEGQIGEG
jgi:hypothetical protein